MNFLEQSEANVRYEKEMLMTQSEVGEQLSWQLQQSERHELSMKRACLVFHHCIAMTLFLELTIWERAIGLSFVHARGVLHSLANLSASTSLPTEAI